MKIQTIQGAAYQIVLLRRIDKLKILWPLTVTREQLKRYIIAEGYGS